MSSPLKVGIVGCAGRGGSFFAPFRSHPGTCLHALCDINAEGMAAQAAELGVEHTYTDCEEMLDRAGVEMLIVGTPMPFHAPQAIMALERGIHVMSEVPAAVNLAEAEALVRAARRSQGRYMMAENYCYIMTNVLVNVLAREGLFGTPYFGEGEYIHELKELNEVTTWRRRWQTGINGCTYPTHSLGPLLQWFGQRVTHVSCFGTGHHYTDPRGDQYENEDSTFVACRLSGGGLANLRLDMLSNRPHNLTYYSLQGTEGCYEAPRGFGDEHKIWLREIHGAAQEWHPLAELQERFLPERWLDPPAEALEAGHWGGDYWEVADFVEAILTDAPIPVGIDEAMDFTLPGLVSQASIEQGSAWLEVPDPRAWV
jgi:predicted dehydrogenase